MTEVTSQVSDSVSEAESETDFSDWRLESLSLRDENERLGLGVRDWRGDVEMTVETVTQLGEITGQTIPVRHKFTIQNLFNSVSNLNNLTTYHHSDKNTG